MEEVYKIGILLGIFNITILLAVSSDVRYSTDHNLQTRSY